MLAARVHEHGGPEVLKIETVPDPQPRADQVLVRVHACGLNHLDIWVRKGIPGIKLPLALGSDVSGEVVATGELCRRIKAGQRVVLSPGLSCRQCIKCLSGKDNECPQYGLLGAVHQGGYAELIAVPEYAVIPIPDNLDYVTAAAAPLVFVTAWHMLMTRAALQPGEDVLVLAASSGVGQAAVQIAKFMHCRVIATAGGEEKRQKAKDLGADHVIDHYEQDISAEVKKITGRGVDVVFEHVGVATWPKSLASMSRIGRLVTCGATTGFDAKVDLRHLFNKQLSLLGSFMGTMAELHTALQFVFSGQLRPIVDRTFPLSEAVAAHQYLEDKQQFGKVVLTV